MHLQPSHIFRICRARAKRDSRPHAHVAARRSKAGLLVCFAACSARLLAQTIWTNGAGGEWNTALNWNPNTVPVETVTAIITNLSGAYTIVYTNPMAATSIGSLTNVSNASGTATVLVNTNGFNLTGAITLQNGARLITGPLGVLNSGSLQFLGTASLVLSNGASVSASGNLALGNSGTGGGAATNFGGSLTVASTTIGGASDGGPFFILGGTNSLGALSVGRAGGGGSGSPPAITSALVVSNGMVNLASAILGANNSWGSMLVVNGIVTNGGDFIIARQSSGSRGGQFLQTGGLVVSTSSSGVRMCVTNGAGANTQIATFAVTGGTNVAEGFVLGDSSVTGGTVNFTNAGKIVVGSVGLVTNNAGTAYAIILNGGTFAANADWASPLAMAMGGGTCTFVAADLDGVPHDISLSGRLSGSAGLFKSGSGTLTLNGTNTYAGPTIIAAGTIVLGANGSVSNSPAISVGPNGNATMDVSALNFSLNSGTGQVLAGSGVIFGNVTAGSGTRLTPATNGVGGTLSISNSLTLSGGVTCNFDLSDNPNANGVTKTNDQIVVAGDLNLSGLNTIALNPLNGSYSAGTYKLISYGGALTGGATNLGLSGFSGTGLAAVLSDATPNQINLVVFSNNSANLTWKGDGSLNKWDINTSLNWLNGVTPATFHNFDNVTFDDTGSISPPVNVTTTLTPSSIFINATGNYTFSGSGSLAGEAGMTKSNSGTLTLLTENSYNGGTLIAGGILQAGNGGATGSLGAGNITNNAALVFNRSSSLTIGTIISGTGVLTNRSGILNLSAGNTYTGPTTVAGGIVSVSADSALGAAPAASTANQLTLNGGTLQAAASFALATNRGLTLGASGGAIDTTNSSTLTYSNIVSGPGALTKNGSGTLSLAQNISDHTYVGLTLNAGAMAINRNTGLGIGAVLVNAGTVQAYTARTITNTVLLNGDLTLGATNTGPLTCSGTWTITNGSHVITSDTITNIISGPIGQDAAGRGLTKAGSGTLVLSGANTYTGDTTLNAGTLIVNADTNLGLGANFNFTGSGTSTLSFGVATTNFLSAKSMTLSTNGGICYLSGDNPNGAIWNGPISGGDSSQLRKRGANPITFIGSSTLSSNLFAFIVEAGALTIDTGGSLTANGSNSLFNIGRAATATMTVKGTGRLTLGAVDIVGAQANGIGTLTIQDTASVSVSSFELGENSTNGSGTINLNGGTLTTGFMVKGAGNGTLNLNGGKLVTSMSTNNFIGGTISASVKNGGAIIDTAGNSVTLTRGLLAGGTGGLTKLGAGTLLLNAANTYAGLTTVSNGVLGGSGTIASPVFIAPGGTFAPGAAGLGSITVNNYLTNAGTLAMDANKTGATLTSDNIAGLLGITYGGTLQLTITGDPLVVGDAFSLFSAAAYTGAFTSIVPATPGFNLAWDTNSLTVDGTLRVATPVPHVTGMTRSGTNIIYSGSGGLSLSNYVVLAATNVQLPRAAWTPILSNTFDVNGNFTFTNPISPNIPIRFYLIRSP